MGLNQEIVQDLMISIHTILTLLELQTKEYKQEAQCAQKGFLSFVALLRIFCQILTSYFSLLQTMQIIALI